MKSNINKRLTEALKQQLKTNRRAFIIWLILRLLVIATLVRCAMRGDYSGVFICLLVLFVFVLPSIVRRRYGIEMPSGMQIVIMLHIFAAEILGELSCYFVQYPYWDTLLHTVWGFLCAAFGYSLVDILNRDNNTHFSLSPIYLALSAFCFSMTIGVLWEFFEFAMDRIFLLDMQKDTVINLISSVTLDETHKNIPVIIDGISSVAVNGQELGLGGYLDVGLYDTMDDLLVNFIGALLFSTIGYFSAKHDNNDRFTSHFVPRLAEDGKLTKQKNDS